MLLCMIDAGYSVCLSGPVQPCDRHLFSRLCLNSRQPAVRVSQHRFICGLRHLSFCQFHGLKMHVFVFERGILIRYRRNHGSIDLHPLPLFNSKDIGAVRVSTCHCRQLFFTQTIVDDMLHTFHLTFCGSMHARVKQSHHHKKAD